MTIVPFITGVLCSFFINPALANGVTQVVITGAKHSPVELRCGNIELEYKWTLDGEVFENNGSYAYNITDPKAVGIYKCEATLDNQTFLVMNFTEPAIDHTSKSIIVMAGDEDKTLVCRSNSYPAPTFHWILKKEGVEMVNLSSISSSTYSIVSEGTSSTLTISKVTAEVRADYQCSAYNNAGNGTYTILVRVHDNIAALWAFLGIVAELLILAIVMLIVSRRNREKAVPDTTPAESRNPPASEASSSQRHAGKEE